MKRLLVTCAIALAAGFGGTQAFRAAGPAWAADHKDAPGARLDPVIDINDMYIFKGATSGNVVIAMTVNPAVLPEFNSSSFFSPNATYRLHIDRNGDAVEDFTYNVTFGPLDSDRRQNITVNGVSAGQTTSLTTATAVANSFTLGGVTHTIFAGLRQDPFFFDLTQFNRFIAAGGLGGGGSFRNPGVDTFENVNTGAIVIEVPASFLTGTGNTRIDLFGTTVK